MSNLQLARILKEKHLTQAKVAKDLNVKFSTFSNWCRCVTEPDINELIKLSEYLDVSVDKLVGSKRRTVSIPIVVLKEAKQHYEALLKIYEKYLE